MKVSNRAGEIKLRILIDRYSVEIFVNDGEQVMTSLIYTPLDASGIYFESNGKTILDVKNTILRCCNEKYDVAAMGELLIDFTQNGYSDQGNPIFEANPGGAPCNVLAMLQKLGKNTVFWEK